LQGQVQSNAQEVAQTVQQSTTAGANTAQVPF
jgi:hypothetical protein